jgi:hypothetical protein
MSLNEQELLKKQRKGAMITASIVAAIAIGIFILTLYLSR